MPAAPSPNSTRFLRLAGVEFMPSGQSNPWEAKASWTIGREMAANIGGTSGICEAVAERKTGAGKWKKGMPFNSIVFNKWRPHGA